MRKGNFCLLLFLFIPQILISKDEYLLPLKEIREISSVFADHRDFHFHSGVDFKTGGKTGAEVRAVESGWVYRLIASWWGYGKAVYLKHPDGKLTVYAHLSEFPKKLEKLVIEKQLQNRNYKVDFLLDNTVWINRGEVIGYSGESGSGAPHLHFEIRDKNNKPINPLSHGFRIVDTFAPVLNKILIKPLDLNSHVDGSDNHQIYPLYFDSTEQVYILKKNPVVVGKIGIEISIYDKITERGNNFGIYKLELYHDTLLLFSSQYDTIDFENSWKVELDRDYELLHKKGMEFYKLYLESGNDLPLYYTFNKGVLDVENKPVYKVNILAEDALGNISKAEFFLKTGKKPEISDILLLKNETGYVVSGSFKSEEKVSIVTVEASPLDKISWRKLNWIESKNSISGFAIQLKDLTDEPRVLRIKARNDLELDSEYVFLLHGKNGISENEKAEKFDSQVEFSLNGNYWIFEISFKQILQNIPEVFLQSGELKVLPLHSKQRDERNFRFVFPFFELYLPGILLNIKATDIFGNEQQEVKYLDVFIAKENSKTIAENLNGEAKVEIDSGTVFNNINILIKRIDKPKSVKQSLLSPLYSFSPSAIPFAKPVKIAISYKGKNCEPFKTGLYEYRGNSFKFIGQEIDTLNKFISGRVRSLSTYALLEDQKSPSINKVFPKSNQKIKDKNLVISAWIKDELSGIGDEKDIEVLLDEEWLIPEYDPEKFYLTSKPLKIIKPGWHEIVIKVKDRVGNEEIISHKFKVTN